MSTWGTSGVGGLAGRNGLLLPGRYWIDLFTARGAHRDGETVFRKWMAMHPQGVVVERTEDHVVPQAFGSPIKTGSFVIFRTLVPTVWPKEISNEIGFPSTAPPSIQSAADTVQRPPPESPFSFTIGALFPIALAVILLASKGSRDRDDE